MLSDFNMPPNYYPLAQMNIFGWYVEENKIMPDQKNEAITTSKCGMVARV